MPDFIPDLMSKSQKPDSKEPPDSGFGGAGNALVVDRFRPAKCQTPRAPAFNPSRVSR